MKRILFPFCLGLVIFFHSLCAAAPIITSGPTADPAVANVGQLVRFAAASTDPNGTTLRYLWFFSDGTGAVGGAGPTGKVFSSPGQYAVVLVVSDGKGGAATGITTFQVGTLSPTNRPPQVSPITAPSSAILVGQNAFFRFSATDPDGDRLSYQIICGDTASGSGTGLACNFQFPGEYTIVGIASDDQGAVTTTSKKIQVVNNPPSNPPSNPPPGVATYYVSPKSTSGSGTLADPFGLPDLLNTATSPITQGPALKVLKPGDTLFFLAGDYHISGSINPTHYGRQLLCPTVSGTASNPITLQAYPGAVVNIVVDAGVQPTFGTRSPALDYVRFLGFSIDPGPGIPAAGTSSAGGPAAFAIKGTGHEIGYCKLIGHYIATIDNHAAIRLDLASNTWIHHNEIYGTTGDGPNSGALEIYAGSGVGSRNLFEDNYVHRCWTAIHDKDAGNVVGGVQNTYRRNYVTNNTIAWLMGNQNNGARYFIYDNVTNANINLGINNGLSQIHNNLVFCRPGNGTDTLVGASRNSYGANVWNNIALNSGRAIFGYWDNYVPYVQSGPAAPVAYMDYNVYDGDPTYSFQNGVFNLARFRDEGFETHATVTAASNIFVDQVSYQLKQPWTTAGRFGDPVGPRFPVAKILDLTRYGPRALDSGPTLAVLQQPEDQRVDVGMAAVFSVQASGVGLSYQWQRSANNAQTWTTISGAARGVLFLENVQASDNGSLFRCVVSNGNGSLASQGALLLIRQPGPATAYFLKGPATAMVGMASDPFTVTPNGSATGVVTLSDGGAGGVFSPAQLQWSGFTEGQTFTYTPASLGTVFISIQSELSNPPPLSLVVTDKVISPAPPIPGGPIPVNPPPGSSPSPKAPNMIVLSRGDREVRFECDGSNVRIFGRQGEVRTLNSSAENGGRASYVWDLKNNSGRLVSSGIYKTQSNGGSCAPERFVVVK